MTADSALESQRSIVQEMRELALQAVNTTLSSAERAQINDALSQLVSDFQRISSETEFNGIKLLDGSLENLQLQIGANAGDEISFSLDGTQASEAFQDLAPTGEFSTEGYTNNGSPFGELDLVDLNNDGNLDRVYTNTDDDELYFELGRGDGTFEDATGIGATDAHFFKVVDFNEDGNLDIVTASDGDLVEIYLGNGQGSFEFESDFSYNLVTTQAIEVLDYDSDGDLDIIRFGNNGASSSIQYIENDGDQGLSFDTAVAMGSVTQDTETADVDGDGILDLIYTRNFGGKGGSGALGIRLGNGDGTFKSADEYTVQVGGDPTNRPLPEALALGDIDGDGDLDILVSNSGNQLVSFDNQGDGTFDAAVEVSEMRSLTDMELVDINGDGHLDVLGSSDAFGIGDKAFLAIWLGAGDGSFSESQSQFLSESSGFGGEIAIGDLNSNGILDIAVAGSGLGSGNAVFFGGSKSTSGLSQIQVNSSEDAENLVEILDETAERILSEQSKVGALLNRLDLSEAYNSLLSANYQEAVDNQVSADYALEVAELLKTQILQQAQVAALSQANLNQQIVLDLLNI